MAASLIDGLKSLNVNELPAGAMFVVTTGTGIARGSKYVFVATNPGRHDAAVLSKSSAIPTRYTLGRILGSVVDGKLTLGIISVGERIFMRDHADISGSVIQTRPVSGIWMVDKAEVHAKAIVQKAEEYFAAAIDGIIRKEFPNDRYSCIAEMIARFGNPAGKSAALGALLRATISNLADNKLGAAMETLQLYWHRFWAAEFPEAAGDPDAPLNEGRWTMFDEDRDRIAKELAKMSVCPA